jgi:SpoU rRNA methylase family enzyme
LSELGKHVLFSFELCDALEKLMPSQAACMTAESASMDGSAGFGRTTD